MNTSLIFCATCGRSVPPEAAFCPGCGTQVVPAVTVHLADEAATPTVVGGRPQYGEGPFRAGDQVGPRYTILKLLGAGGMGAVYQAFDHELGVGVAIKVIRPAAQSDATAARDLEQRFKRELVLARQITHKYVVRIHDIGEIDGVKYLTMPYIDGETLADVLRREGKLSIPRTLAIATQVASGLAAAHDKGIVHRDLKPENIMIEKDGGDALIMDFGIARTVESGSTQTAAGSVIGTLEYMAPEQAQGKKVDGRADVYALGLILYDCLVGRLRLAQTENPMTELLSRLAHSPTAPRQIDASIPEPLDRLVQRCLNPAPGERFESTADLVRALEGLTPEGHLRATDAFTIAAAAVPRVRRPAWQLAAVAALVLLAASAGWLLSKRGTPDASAAARDPLSVLVAEFDNRTGDAVFDGVLEQALGLGLEGATFITAYPQRDALRSAAAIKAGSRLDEATSLLVAVREGVKLVLAGALLPSGSGYQLSVRAIDPAQGKDVASATETAADKSEVLEAIGEIATRLRRDLGDTAAGSGEAGRETFTAASIEGARAYVLAQELAAAGKFGEAIVQYQEAVQRDPDFGRAYSGWATAAFRAGRPDEADALWKKSLALLERMTEREKYRTLGTYYLGPGANDEQAVQNYRMLVERYPADGPGLNNLAVAYFRTLDFKKAQEQGLKAAAAYPNSLAYRTNVALYAMYAGDFATAAAEAKKAIAMSPFDKAYLPVAIEALAAGNADGARAAYTEMAKASARGASIASMGKADVDMVLGRYPEARAELLSGAAADEAANLRLPHALKLIALAEIASVTSAAEAAALAARALELVATETVAVPASRFLIAGGRGEVAAKLAADLEARIQKRSRAMAAVIRAEAALAAKKPVAAIDELVAARSLADLWLVRYLLGRAFVEHGRFADALAELDACETRIGEASDIFLDDWPTFRYTVPVKYWLARAQDGLGQRDSAVRNYQAYLDRREQVAGDPLATDARKRMSR